MIDVSSFTFSLSSPNSHDTVRVIDVPPSLTTKSEVIRAIAKVLGVPEYFDENWDALDESLRDLSWVPERSVVIRHSEVPPLPMDVLRVYLDVLARAVQGWRGSMDHELVVSFPPAAREEVTLAAKGPVPGVDRDKPS